MKTTYKTHEIAHAWAYDESPRGKCSSNIFFDGATIYSYGTHFPICKKMEVKGQLYYFWNDRTYSPSTSKHQSYVRQAIPDKANIIKVSVMPDNWPETHKRNIKYFAGRIIRAKELEQKAKGKKDDYRRDARIASHELQRYCDLFDVIVPESLLIDPDNFDVNKYYADMAARKLTEIQLQIKRNKAKIKEETKKFRSGLNFSNCFPFDLLRLSDDCTMVETSQRVKVDIRPVKMLWCMIQQGINVVGRHIGKYEIKEVTKKTIRVGCHNFERKEVLRLINSIPL